MQSQQNCQEITVYKSYSVINVQENITYIQALEFVASAYLIYILMRFHFFQTFQKYLSQEFFFSKISYLS